MQLIETIKKDGKRQMYLHSNVKVWICCFEYRLNLHRSWKLCGLKLWTRKKFRLQWTLFIKWTFIKMHFPKVSWKTLFWKFFLQKLMPLPQIPPVLIQKIVVTLMKSQAYLRNKVFFLINVLKKLISYYFIKSSLNF